MTGRLYPCNSEIYIYLYTILIRSRSLKAAGLVSFDCAKFFTYIGHFCAFKFCLLSVVIGNDACVFSRVSANFLIAILTVCLHILIIFGNIFNVFAPI